jgi:hypothetical protein
VLALQDEGDDVPASGVGERMEHQIRSIGGYHSYNHQVVR